MLTFFKSKGISKKEALSYILLAKCTDSKESKFSYGKLNILKNTI